VYATEICSDIALGVTTQILWLVILIQSCTTEILMDSMLKPEGVFILFGIFSMLAVGFEWYLVGETLGLSERQKKSLYQPGNEYGRKIEASDLLNEPGSPELSMFSRSNISSMRSVVSKASSVESNDNT